MHCLTPIRIHNPKRTSKNPGPFLDVPCGKCYPCIQRKATEWVTRFEIEAKKSNITPWFCTFTYEDTYLPKDGVDKDTCKRFVKQLKERWPSTKYMLISEYGPTTFRPHYHAILFHTTIDHYELQHFLNRYWKRGNVKSEEVTMARMHYIAGYQFSRSEVLPGQNKNFRLVSQGLGKPADGDLLWIGELRKTGIRTSEGRLVPIPKYVLQKVCTDEQLHLIQEKKRKCAEDMFKKDKFDPIKLHEQIVWNQVKLNRSKKQAKSI